MMLSAKQRNTFTKIAKELFDIDVPYREVQFFNLQKAFDLSEEQYDELMKAGHIPENLLDYEETPGASRSDQQVG